MKTEEYNEARRQRPVLTAFAETMGTDDQISAARLAKQKMEAARLSVVRPHWYELDWMTPFRDLLLIAGGMAFVGGVAWINKPAGLMVLGLLVMRLAWLMGKSK